MTSRIVLFLVAGCVPLTAIDAQGSAERWLLFQQRSADALWEPATPPDMSSEGQARHWASNRLCTAPSSRPNAIKIVGPRGDESVIHCARLDGSDDGRWTVLTQSSDTAEWTILNTGNAIVSQMFADDRASRACSETPIPLAEKSVSPSGRENVVRCRLREDTYDDTEDLAEVARRATSCVDGSLTAIFFDCACLVRDGQALVKARHARPDDALDKAAAGCVNPPDVLEARYNTQCLRFPPVRGKNAAQVCGCTAAGVAKEYTAPASMSLGIIERVRNPVLLRCLREHPG